ncbi:MAG: hypothetical protein ACLR8U_00185 [Oscillospiraceae bacterium]
MLTGSTSVIESWNKEKTAKLVAEAYRKSGAQRLVMGFPRNMDGSEGPRADLLPGVCREARGTSGAASRLMG